MGLHIDKPLPGEDDLVVVYMARDPQAAARARDALNEVGMSFPIDMPDAALEAMFEAGEEQVPIRVPAQDFSKAMDVIDDLFPDEGGVPEVELPPLPAEGEAKPAGLEQGQADGVELDDAPQREAMAKARKRKLEGSAGKVIAIGAASVLIPGLGALLALFTLYSGYWCLTRAQEHDVPKAAGRAKAALGLGLLAVLVQAAWIYMYVARGGV